MYCGVGCDQGSGLGADSFIPGGQKVGGVGGTRTFQQSGAPLPPGFGTKFPPVLKTAQRIPVLCASQGITYYFNSQAEADAFRCPPGATGGAPAAPGAPPATGGPTPGVDYGNPSTYPGQNVPPPSPGTQTAIGLPTSSNGGGGGPALDDSTPTPVAQAGILGGVSPLMLAALAAGAIFLLRKRR